MSVHTVAENGFAAGTNELYDRARPSYRDDVLANIRSSAVSTPLNVVELGSGTGIFTRALLSHADWKDSVKELKAFEPSSGMRQVFSNTVKDERVSVADGTFQTIGVEDGWADIIIIAQAFHWCPDFAAASAEFARVLKSGGVLALVWNLEDMNAARWVAGLRNRIEQHEKGTPQFRLGLWRQAFDTAPFKEFFGPPKENSWSYTLPANLELVLDRASSKSYIAVLSDEERASVLEDVSHIVKRGDDKVWIDEAQGVFAYPYETFLVTAYKN